MKLYKLLSVALLGLAGASAACATTLSYDHKYEDFTKEHTDELKLSHRLSSGFGASLKLKFAPDDQENGEPGLAFHDERWKETAVGINYSDDVNEDLTLEPGFTWARKQDVYKYKPYLKLKYALPYQLDFSSRYRYEITDYLSKKTKKTNRFDAGISRKFGAVEAGYTLTLYKSDAELYNNRKSDYKHAVEFKYKLSKKFAPFIELSNVSVSKHNDQRQTEFEIGAKYKF